MSGPSLVARARVVPAAQITPDLVQAMWTLFERYYAGTTFARFESDLAKKNLVVVLEEGAEVVGFTTVQLYYSEFEGKKVRILYSGDTIKDRRYWGEKKMNVAFARMLVLDYLRNFRLPYYWFLISKGHKTYLVLTSKFPHSWPRRDRVTPPFEAGLLEHLAREKFGDTYYPEEGLLRFPSSMGRLKVDAVPVEERDLANADARFFLQKNPGYLKGHELCCLAKIDGALLRGIFVRGLKLLFFPARRALPPAVPTLEDPTGE